MHSIPKLFLTLLSLCTGCPSIQYSIMVITCHCTSKGCGQMGGRQTKNYIPIRIKLVSLRWPPTWLTVLLRTNLKQLGSTLHLLLSWMMYLRLHQLLFQVEGYGLVHCETLFPTQSISQQLIHLPVKTSFVISSVD